MKLLLLFTFVCVGQAQSGGEGQNCYSSSGTQLKCGEGLTCSSETKTCQYTNICSTMGCIAMVPDCKNGLKALKADPSKCRCCATCGVDENQTGCDSGKTCNPKTGVCEFTNICASTMCAQVIPNCSEGTKLLPKDPSKCRCCSNTCGVDENQTGCEAGKTCNPTTGVCEAQRG